MLYEFPPFLIRSFALVFGLLWGSFLNVVICRVPRGESVVSPASKCPACGVPIRPWNNIPLVSYLLLRGRAKCCGIRIPVRYFLVELSGGLLSLSLVQVVVMPMPAADTTLWFAAAMYAMWFALAMALLAAAFIDLEHMFIPDTISIGAIVLGLATYWLRPPLSLTESIAASATGFVVVWLVFGVLYRLLRGRTGMGLGDAKLLAVAGAWFGFGGMLFALMAAAVQGTVAALVVLLIKGRIEEPAAVQEERASLLAEVASISDPAERAEAELELSKDPIFEQTGGHVGEARIAFGPFLVLAMLEYLLLGDILMEQFRLWLAIG